MILWAVAAFAVDPPPAWEARPVLQPTGSFGTAQVNGRSSLQVAIGASLGARYQRRRPYLDAGVWARPQADLAGRTLLSGNLRYDLSDGHAVASVSLGTFVGPVTRVVGFETGLLTSATTFGPSPALGASPPSVGVTIANSAWFLVVGRTYLQLGVWPGWEFVEARQFGWVGPFHEVTAFVAVSTSVSGLRGQVGYYRTYNGGFWQQGPLLSIGF